MNATIEGAYLVDDSAEFSAPFFYALGALELAILAVQLPASLANLLLIGRTHLIHPNMKLILLYQSACILIRGIFRCVICAFKFAYLAPLSAELVQPWRNLFLFCVYNRNFCAHVLILERLVATVLHKSYEHRKQWCNLIALCWIPLVLLTSAYNIVSQGDSIRALSNVVVNSGVMLIGLMEFALFIWLHCYNKRAYLRTRIEQMDKHDLSERYQLSENIRIGAQLVPALAFHLVAAFSTTLGSYVGFFFGAHFFAYFLVSANAIGSLCGLAIEVTMIVCHPFLRRDLVCFWKRIFTTNRVDDGSPPKPPHSTDLGAGAIAVRDILSGRLILNAKSGELDKHFAQLRDIWEKD